MLFRMTVEFPEIPADERTPAVESLLALVRQLLDRVGQLEETNQRLRDEIAVLKGQKPKPQIRPSVLATTPKPPPIDGQKRPGSAKLSKTPTLKIDHEITLHPTCLPARSSRAMSRTSSRT